MDGPFDIAVLRRNLSALMTVRGVKPTTLSLKVGNSPTLVKEILEKTTDTKLSTIYKLAAELGVPVNALLTKDIEPSPLGPALFVKGEVAAGEWVEAFEWPRDDWQTMTGRPDILAAPEHRFFLRVSGDSMNLLYPEGTFIECVSVFGNVEAAPGKRVVVLRKRREDHKLEATVKEMVEMDGAIWLAPRSTNPAHQAYRVERPGADIEEVRIVAVVVASVRPE